MCKRGGASGLFYNLPPGGNHEHFGDRFVDLRFRADRSAWRGTELFHSFQGVKVLHAFCIQRLSAVE